MAIALDFSGTIFAALHVDIKGGQRPHLEYIRHLVLNTIRAHNLKYRDEWGEMHLIFDSSAWRNKEFPLYKWTRKNSPDEDNDWEEIMTMISQITEEIKDNFPYPTMKVQGAEADDIIGWMAQTTTEPLLIISNDKDFGALLQNPLVKQTRPCDKIRKIPYVKIDDPKRFEFDLIMHGDESDGVPSVRCPDDFFKVKFERKQEGLSAFRAPPISQKLKDEAYEALGKGEEVFRTHVGEEMYARFVRNRKLISLNLEHIPESVVLGCERAWENRTRHGMNKTMNFMMQKRMSLFLKELTAFKPNCNPVQQTSIFDL